MSRAMRAFRGFEIALPVNSRLLPCFKEVDPYQLLLELLLAPLNFEGRLPLEMLP